MNGLLHRLVGRLIRLSPRCRRFAARVTAGGMVLAVLLGGCAQPVLAPPPSAPWAARQAALDKLHTWSMTGRISITTEREGWHASLNWTQQGQDYTIDLIGPLGQGRIHIHGNGAEVSVQTADGQTYRASDADRLLEEAVGLRIPIKGLRYWIRGLPDPLQPSQLAGDEQGRLTRLEQTGWIIEYPAYAAVAGLDLPAQIRARQDRLQVRIAVRDWNLSPPALATSSAERENRSTPRTDNP